MAVEYARVLSKTRLCSHNTSFCRDLIKQIPEFYYRWLKGLCRLLVPEILRLVIYQDITNLYLPFYQAKTNYILL